MKATELVPGVHWVGAIDWNLREYHGYTLPGTTYNAYLVRGEKTALIDGAYAGFEEEVLGRIRSVCDPAEIDYIVVNHIEKDHSGSLPAFVRRMPGVPIYCTEKARAGLARHYDTTGWNIQIVKSGDTLDLGGKTLTFLEAPMLHWPDSMFTYLAEDAVLFPNDAFGQHVASAARFDDELGRDAAMVHAQKFFANLIVPLAPKVLKKLDEVGGLGIDIRMIAPSHGVIWRSHPGDILKAYIDWSRGVAKEKVTIVYDTMHGSTTMLAKAIAEGVMAEGADVRVCLLRDGRYEGTHRSDIVTEVLDSKAVLVGSPTLQDEVLPTVAGFLSYLRGLRPGRLGAKKIGCAFGSHGGMGGAVAEIEGALKEAGIEVIDGGFQVNYRPDGDELARAFELGRRVAREIRAR
ncbi:FprA family A-type flavoprotein [Methanoculleus sp. Wushi-C6]|uniref:FprA family A-type flavoprotein n=1 Tax=Methanoculleus caldifontis TaxID=2651577 RepID=A0ABU3X1A8_9EURY|nr:FprA family A-type flavoprotein [Methanoculleus sp. Wushi-C6]MDV2481397.1 FprA family A-type flavoprotein [Methanoculleus sp. Wushi-C6]